MPDPIQNDKDAPKKMTAAEAAKLVKRAVVKTKDGKPLIDEKTKQPFTELAPIAADEVLSFADYGTHVVVVTTRGEKLRGDKGGK